MPELWAEVLDRAGVLLWRHVHQLCAYSGFKRCGFCGNDRSLEI